MSNISDIFGTMVFNDKVMKERLPKETYSVLKKCVEEGAHLDLDNAHIIADAMKNWALEKGATHFTHWFQPMTGITAEKHDSFISPDKNGGVIMEFSGKALVQGEPDASSFPSGGLRATFEARGYTAWDPTSYAFIKDASLCIPTAFCSYGGQALDKKTPLIRSMQAISRQANRILKLFKSESGRAITTVGAEQEYFLIDKTVCEKRMDLITCGRTLFGAKPPKGQEMDDHYFGAIKARVSAFMKNLDEELWKLGVLSKTKHNEAAPSQHELAPVFSTTNIATDHNQIIMELMKSIAAKHNLTCLLHEKPFEGINGSGKHNNWSLATTKGINLLEPGETPHENAQFLLFLVAVIKAVDKYQDLLRVSVSSAGNDHRLGSGEAPPAIISIFLGDELTEILDALDSGKSYKSRKRSLLEIGVDTLPYFSKDTTDRNRTSPFAFTGNKFEFRMVGSSASVADPNIILNTIVAEELSKFADKLEKSENFQEDLAALIVKTIKKHKRIIFNGNNYSKEWVEEAEKRGLLNLKTTIDSIPSLIKPQNIQMFEKHCVFSPEETRSRYDIMIENYVKTINIEAKTMIDMARKRIYPSVIKYKKELAECISLMRQLQTAAMSETELLEQINSSLNEFYQRLISLEEAVESVQSKDADYECAVYFKDVILVRMSELREKADELEKITSKEYWALPSYYDLLFSI